MRGLVVPDEEQDSDALLGLVLEQVAEGHALDVYAGDLPELGRLGLHLRRHLLPHQPDPGVHGPPGHVHEPLRAQHRQAQVLPAAPPVATRRVRVVVQPEVAPAPRREVGRDGGAGPPSSGGAAAAGRRDEPGGDADGRGCSRASAAAPVGAHEVQPAGPDGRVGGGEDVRGGDGGGADEVGAEGVGVLDVDVEARRAVREREQEAALPARGLGVAEDVGARERRLVAVRRRARGHHHGRVGVGGREQQVAVRLPPPAVAAAIGSGAAAAIVVVGAGQRAVGGVVAGWLRRHPGRRAEAEAAEEGGEHVHVGEAARLVDGEVEVSVEERRAIVGAAVHRDQIS